jgi:hypothetical protein
VVRAEEGRLPLPGRKSGKLLARYFPDVASLLVKADADEFALDGELLVPRQRRSSFEAQELRHHPAASCVRALAASKPTVFALFDMLVAPGGLDQRAEALSRRRSELLAILATAGSPRFMETPGTDDRILAQAWLAAARPLRRGRRPGPRRPYFGFRRHRPRSPDLNPRDPARRQCRIDQIAPPATLAPMIPA